MVLFDVLRHLGKKKKLTRKGLRDRISDYSVAESYDTPSLKRLWSHNNDKRIHKLDAKNRVMKLIETKTKMRDVLLILMLLVHGSLQCLTILFFRSSEIA